MGQPPTREAEWEHRKLLCHGCMEGTPSTGKLVRQIWKRSFPVLETDQVSLISQLIILASLNSWRQHTRRQRTSH